MPEANPIHSPVVWVIGPTGSGKSKLGVDLARHIQSLGGSAEIINADVMQMYTGLPIATNNVTGEEAVGVRHHFLADKDPCTTVPLSVPDFVKDATALIAALQEKGTTPVIVGGSNYYVQSLLFQEALMGDASSEVPSINLDALDPAELYKLLEEKDPAMAGKYHPNDVRRVRRSLDITLESGQKHSELVLSQNKGALRYLPADRNLVFWVDSERDVLNKRLDDRVDDMVKRGVFEEVKAFWLRYCSETQTPLDTECPTKGIFGAIGFKELYQCTPPGAPTDSLPTYEKGLELMKTNTRRYARQQVQWIRHRFCCHNSLSVLRVDSSEASKWGENVRAKAIEALDAYLKNGVVSEQILKALRVVEDVNEDAKVGTMQMFTCPVCPNKVLTGRVQYDIHLQSRKHKGLLRKAERQPFIEEQQRKKRLKSEESKTTAQ